ncbi:hypothetical protein HK407_09g15050 [Ordospora pajunii]|uniref:uncharacterized protein n=1 Tax=Ordospora pajunii TaxID=3039483 RepID=UPI0029526681|nr:uncharacterized protein HK407_09g15050 [Ordospora pajunii]KAH9410910.1 hypothetical protein HK407_09g15050 [Ordospora pajunii]
MMKLLGFMQENEVVYSFGKVTAMLENNKYILASHDTSVVMSTKTHLEVGAWIRAYGTFGSGILRTVFVGRLTGVDINLFERAVACIHSRMSCGS